MTALLIAVIVFLQLVDGWSTWQVYRFKIGHEDPRSIVTNYLIDTFGLYGGLCIAKSWATVVVLFAHYHGAWAGTWGLAALFALAVFYAAVVANNLKILYGRQ